MVLDAGLIDHVHVAASFQHLHSRVLPRFGQWIRKMELLALHRRTFLDLHREPLALQVEDRNAVYLALPDELLSLLGPEDRASPKKYQQHERFHDTLIVSRPSASTSKVTYI